MKNGICNNEELIYDYSNMFKVSLLAEDRCLVFIIPFIDLSQIV